MALTGCGSTVHETAVEAYVHTPPAQRPISLVLPTAAGGHMDLADHRGRAVLVVAFTTDNLLSQSLLDTLEAVARAHPDDLSVVAIAGDESAARDVETEVRSYGEVLNLHAVELTLATDEVRGGNSPLGEIDHVPTVFLLNRVGVIVRKVEGRMSRAQVEALIAPALPQGH